MKNNFTPSSPFFEHGYALFIGINYYHWASGKLNGTTKDVDDLYNHFTNPQKAGYKPENVIILKEEDATKKNILASLDILAQKAAADVNASILIFFSGHGEKKENQSFLIPYDFNLDLYRQGAPIDKLSAVTSDEFGKKINTISAKKCLVILDCCHAETMTDTKSLRHPFLDDFTEGFDNILEENNINKNIGSIVQSGKGKVILTSCEAEESSLDLGSNGLFTKVLLECLSGEENIEKDGWVRLIDMMRYIPRIVKNRALKLGNHPQNPVFKRIENLSTEEFILCAYDIVQAKGLKSSSKNQQNDFENLINQGEIAKVFKLLEDADSFEPNAQYYRLKKEFAAGLRGIDLMDFSERLKVFISSYI